MEKMIMVWASAAPNWFAPDRSVRLARLRSLAWLIDGVPITRHKVPLWAEQHRWIAADWRQRPVDALSLYIVYEAAQLGIPRPLLAWMIANVAVEVVGGSVPVLGDLFDMALKANLRNLKIIEQHLGQQL